MENEQPTGISKNFYKIELITNDDFEETNQLLDKHFAPNAPLVKALIRPEPFNQLSTTSKKFIRASFIKGGVCLKTVTDDGKIIGACLNNTYNRNQKEEEHEMMSPNGEQICKYLNYIKEKIDVFTRFPEVENVFEIHILSVNPDWSNRGIAMELMKSCRELAIKHECDLILIHCTSAYSARTAQKLGFECIYSLKFEDYIGEDGIPCFKSEGLHAESNVYIQRISSQ